MSLPHRAPIGALRTQAGVKRSETPVKKSRQQTEYRRYDRNSVAPIGACNMPIHPTQGFRYAPPPACVLTPLSGLTVTKTMIHELAHRTPIGAYYDKRYKYDVNKLLA